MSKRTILIVEEEPTISFLLKTYCYIAVSELINNGAGWVKDVDIVLAESLDEARRILNSQEVILISLDLNLEDIDQGRSLSGMVLLRELRKENHQTMVIIVSGQGEIANVTEALLRLKTLGYIIKSELDPQKYIKSIQSVLYYQNAVDLISSFEKKPALNTLRLAEQFENFAEQAAAEGELNYGNFPGEIKARLLALHNRFYPLDKVTQLPSNEWVEEVMREKVVGKTGWSIIRVDIKNLEKLHASQVNPLLVYLTGKLNNLGDEFHYPDIYVGNYFYFSTQRLLFVVVTGQNIKQDFARISGWLNYEFNKDINMFASNWAVENPPHNPADVSLPSLDIQAWHSDRHEFLDLHDVIDAIGQP